MKVAIGSIIVFVLLVAFAGLIYMYSGAYNVSAKAPDSAITAWVLRTTRDRSIENHSGDVSPPADLSNPQMIHAGAERYREDCSACHGSPGDYPGPIGKGLNPRPPKLWAARGGGESRELYWVIMHGIKMTGMPAWDHEYAPDQAWSVVAFLEALPKLSPEQYRQLTGGSPAKQEGQQ